MEYITWEEIYRPKTIEGCILPENIKKTFLSFVETKKFPNMLLNGGPGMGKTTVAKALCDASGHEWIMINGSKDSGIDTLRTTIQDFASQVSIGSHRKCVIIDEAEYLNASSTQPALRGFTEEFSGSCSFIFTCNYKHRLIKELHSRCFSVEFKIPKEEHKTLQIEVFSSLKKILSSEGIPYEDAPLAKHIKKYFPDIRRCLIELQAYAINNSKIDTGILSVSNLTSSNFSEITDILRERNFSKLHEYVMMSEYDPSIFSDIYEYWYKNKKLVGNKLAQAILLTNEYEEKSTKPINPKINLLAFLTEVMMNCEFV